MSQATELPRTEVRGLQTRQTGGFSPRDIHARGEAYPLPQATAIFIALMWPSNAMVFAMKIAPGAAFQTGSVIPAHHPSSPRSLSPTPIGERGSRLGTRASPPASSLSPKATAIFIALMWPGNAMVFPPRSLPRTPIRGGPDWERGRPRPHPLSRQRAAAIFILLLCGLRKATVILNGAYIPSCHSERTVYSIMSF